MKLNTVVKDDCSYIMEYCSIKDVNPEHIEAVVQGKVLALRIKNYVENQSCKQLTTELAKRSSDHYAVAPDISKGGMAVFDYADCPEKFEEHYAQKALNKIREIREFYKPYLSPIDQLRLDMDEIMPGGSTLEVFRGFKAFTGLTRLFRSKSKALPHQDMPHWDLPAEVAFWRMETNLGANIYNKVADSGGELSLWGWGFKSQQEYAEHQLRGSYGLDIEKIGNPLIVITPEEGELIIFNARFIHSVNPVKQSERVTTSTFLSYYGLEATLKLYS